MGQGPMQAIGQLNMLKTLSNVGFDKIVLRLNEYATTFESGRPAGAKGFRSHVLQNLPGAYFLNQSTYITGHTNYVVLLSTLYPSNGSFKDTISGHNYIYGSSDAVTNPPGSNNGLYDITDDKWIRPESNQDLKTLVENFVSYYKQTIAYYDQSGGYMGNVCGQLTKSGQPCRRPKNCGIHRYMIKS